MRWKLTKDWRHGYAILGNPITWGRYAGKRCWGKHYSSPKEHYFFSENKEKNSTPQKQQQKSDTSQVFTSPSSCAWTKISPITELHSCWFWIQFGNDVTLLARTQVNRYPWRYLRHIIISEYVCLVACAFLIIYPADQLSALMVPVLVLATQWGIKECRDLWNTSETRIGSPRVLPWAVRWQIQILISCRSVKHISHLPRSLFGNKALRRKNTAMRLLLRVRRTGTA